LSSSTSFEDVADVECPAGRTAGLEALGDPDIVERRFLASATAPEAAGFDTGVGRLAVVLVVVLTPLETALVVEGLTTGFGLDVLADVADVAGFRAAVVDVDAAPARFSASVSGFAGEW
jgi:hypothetical protein